MRISRLSIDNFRSIQRLEVELPQICALVGPNNAGKSNILEALRRVLGSEWVSVSNFTADDIYLRDPSRDINIGVSLNPPLQYTKFKDSDPVDVHALRFRYTRYKVGAQKGQPRLEQSCLDANGKTPMVLARVPRKGEARKYEPIVGVPSDIREQVPLVYMGTNRLLREQLPAARNSLLRRIFQNIDADLRSPEQIVDVITTDGTKSSVPRVERFREILNQAMELLRTDAFNDVERSLKRHVLRQLGFDPDTDADKLDISFMPFDTLAFYRSLDLIIREGGIGGFAVSATEMGEGVQNAIVLAILQVFEETQRKGAILLIEEPEMFLHPQMQRALYKTIRRIGERNQVIYTTHSPHFVAVPDYHDVILVRRGTEGSEIRMSDLLADSKRREKLVKELDPERNELFFARRLLLVEGDTEKLALPIYAQRLGYDLDREGATIVEVGGKRNIREFVQLARSFNIPTGILYDADSSDFDKTQKADENAYNAALDALDTGDCTIRVWKLDANYETHLRTALGESTYLRLCQQFPNIAKPTRARLIAMETESAIPEPIPEVLAWLVGGP